MYVIVESVYIVSLFGIIRVHGLRFVLFFWVCCNLFAYNIMFSISSIVYRKADYDFALIQLLFVTNMCFHNQETYEW